MPTALLAREFPAAPSRELPPWQAVAAPAMAAAVLASQAQPRDPKESRRQTAVATALGRLDGNAAAAALTPPENLAQEIMGFLPAYALAVATSASFTRLGLVLDGGERLLRLIRQQIREGLLALGPLSGAAWLVPASADDLSAAHVAALLLTRDGAPARPWLWPGRPDHGPFHILGSEPNLDRATGHPAASDARCDGILDFTQLAARRPLCH